MRCGVLHITPVLLLLLSGCGSGDERGEPVMDERTPLAQEVTERVFADGTFEIVDTLHVDEPTFTPGELIVLEDGNVLVYDRGSYQLLRIDPDDDRIVARYGEGVGSGPGEHLDVTSIGEFNSGQIWSFDRRGNSVNVFDADGRLDRRIKLENMANEVVSGSADRIVGVNSTIENPFRVYDADGRSSGGFGWLLDDPGLESLAFSGRTMAFNDGGFVYVMQFADLLKAYDADGELLWFRRLIDGRDPLDVVPTDDGSYTLDYPEHEAINRLPLNAANDVIHIIVTGHEEEAFYVDTYDAGDGSYVGTRRFPIDERMCGPKYILDATTVWLICDSATMLARARIPALP